jgi:hypothetical protein
VRIKLPKHGLVPVALLMEPTLTLADLKVYTALASFQGSNDDAYPSREAIVERCGCAVETVSRSVMHLLEMRWIQRDRRPNQSSIYRVLLETDEVSEMTAPSLPGKTGNDRPVTLEMTAPSLPSIKQKEHFKRTVILSDESQPVILATLLLTERRKADTVFMVGKEKAAVHRWATDIEKLIRLDKRTPEEIRAVILWCQAPGCFWASNVLSGSKLREKFDTLLGQSKMRSSGQKKMQFGFDTFDPSREVPDEIRM